MNDMKKQLIGALGQYLANLHVLYVKLHGMHWNVEGRQFFQLHEKLEELYDGVAEELDAVAERILMLGGRPAASMRAFLDQATLKEMESGPINGDAVLQILQADMVSLSQDVSGLIELAGNGGDAVTEGMMTDSLGRYQKLVWMLRAAKA